MLDFLNIDLDDTKTWDLIGEGRTKGCFQIDSNLGKSWCRKIKPRNIEQLSAVNALIRPGCMEAELEGKSMTQHYCDRKNGIEPVTYYHEALEDILSSTKGILIYQEQAIAIVTKIAGFNPQDADSFRKACGKKIPEEMAKIKIKFLDGAIETNIVNKQEAEEIFSWIEKSQRYSFNKSHSVSYAIAGYWSAFCKANYTHEFYKAYLNGTKSDPNTFDEIASLVLDAKMLDINIALPDLRKMNDEFIISSNNEIIYGLTSIRGVGASHFEKLKNIVGQDRVELLNMYNVIMILSQLNKSVAHNLIHSGACDFVGESRAKLDFVLHQVLELTVEFKIAVANYKRFNSFKTLFAFLEESTKTKRRKEIVKKIAEKIENPPFATDDNMRSIIESEKYLLGISLSGSDLDMYDTYMANITCREFINNPIENAVIAVEIMEVREVVTKKGKSIGQKMAFIKCCDSTGMLDNVTIFASSYEEFGHLLSPENSVLIIGKRDKKYGSFIINKVKKLDV